MTAPARTPLPHDGHSVTVAGGGIAGLAAATAFARQGAKVSLYEKADALREFGAGLQITPNGGAVLRALGLEARAAAISIAAQALEPIDALTGRRLARFDLTARGATPYRFFHRGDLLDLLAQGAREAGVDIVTGAQVGWSDEGAVIHDHAATADLMVGAEGLHSGLRAILNGGDRPQFTGQVAWRAVIEMADADPVARIWMAPGRHVVTYPLPDGRLNLIAVQERKGWTAEGWNHPDEPANLRAAFSDVCPALGEILLQVRELRLWGLFRHPVAQHWHDKSRAIIGDAAHPTLPFLAQGANMALEDAWVLARETGRGGDLAAGLARFQALRRPRAARAIAAANANAVNYHLSGARRGISHLGLAAIGRMAPTLFMGRYDWLYDHDVTAG